MDQLLSRLKQNLIDLKTTGIYINPDLAQGIKNLKDGFLMGSALGSEAIAVPVVATVEALEQFRPESQAASEATFKHVVIPSALATLEADRMGLLTPSIASGAIATNPFVGTIIASDVAAHTDSRIDPTTGYMRLKTPSAFELESVNLLKRGGNISRRRKLLRKRRVSRNRK
jgi:hypothetical protein